MYFDESIMGKALKHIKSSTITHIGYTVYTVYTRTRKLTISTDSATDRIRSVCIVFFLPFLRLHWNKHGFSAVSFALHGTQLNNKFERRWHWLVPNVH